MSSTIDHLIAQMNAEAVGGTAQPISPTTQDDVSTYDFAQYEFVLDPFLDSPRLPAALTPEAIDYLDELQTSGASVEVVEYMADLLLRLETSVRQGVTAGLPARRAPGRVAAIDEPAAIGADIPGAVLRNLYSLHRRLIPKVVDLDREVPDFLALHLYEDMRAKARRMWLQATHSIAVLGDAQYQRPLYDWPFFVESVNWWVLTPDLEVDHIHLGTDLEHAFEPYSTAEVNVGIAVLYRQRWTALGAQPGEVVRTVPLGPGQSEKVATKVVRRDKATRTTETTTETESTTRSANTAKDSAEVVKEATSNKNWSVSASASYGVGGIGFGASASGQLGGSSSKGSKATTANLSEIMKETASKLRQQTKVLVSTESETSFEQTYTSEVRNANDEVPLTLQYHMLQTMYEVYTYLHAVQKVVFVPERLPAPYQVDVAWIRRHDWIIANELLDE